MQQSAWIAGSGICHVGGHEQVVVGEDLGHMFIQPIHLMAHGIFDLLQFLIDQINDIFLFGGDPGSRADRLLRPRARSSHGDVNKQRTGLAPGGGVGEKELTKEGERDNHVDKVDAMSREESTEDIDVGARGGCKEGGTLNRSIKTSRNASITESRDHHICLICKATR